MTAHFCRDCLVNEVSPTARDGRCEQCKPRRRHSQPKGRQSYHLWTDSSYWQDRTR